MFATGDQLSLESHNRRLFWIGIAQETKRNELRQQLFDKETPPASTVVRIPLRIFDNGHTDYRKLRVTSLSSPCWRGTSSTMVRFGTNGVL